MKRLKNVTVNWIFLIASPVFVIPLMFFAGINAPEGNPWTGEMNLWKELL